MEEKVKKSNFKEALKRHWEKQASYEYCLASQKLGTASKPKQAAPLLYLLPDRKCLPTSEVYVERHSTEWQCYENLLQPGSLVRIEAPKLMGKTSLMERVLVKLKKHGDRAASLSLKMADRQTHFNNLNQFLRWVCLNLNRQLNLPNQLDKYWDAEGIGAKVSCTTYLEEYILAASNIPLVLFIDDVEVLFPYPEIYEDWFGLLRCWCEKSRSDPSWQKLRLAIAHTSEVYTRLHLHQSPFSIGLSIELPELTKEQVQEFAKQCGLAENLSLVDPLMQLLGGHPYLLQQAFFHFKSYPNINFDQFFVEAPTNAGIYRYHLRELWLSLQQNPKLMAAFQAVRDSNKSVSLEALSVYQLHSMGLVKFERNQIS